VQISKQTINRNGRMGQNRTLNLLCCLGKTLNWFPAHWLRRLGVFAHLAAAPAVIISVMNIGLLLPLVAILWLRVYRASVNTHPS
jgi:hypothetical protein